MFKKKEQEVVSVEKRIDYKYSEDRILKELSQYIDKTYNAFIIPTTNFKQQNSSWTVDMEKVSVLVIF